MRKLFLLILIIVCVTISCSEVTDKTTAYKILPIGADNVVEHGNGWVEFSFKGNRFLYHYYNSGYYGKKECVTQIEEK
jgi:hypothetical protein